MLCYRELQAAVNWTYNGAVARPLTTQSRHTFGSATLAQRPLFARSFDANLWAHQETLVDVRLR